MGDLIIINELTIHAPLGASRWPKPGSELFPQPLSVTVKASVPVSQAGISDHLADSVNYSSLAKGIVSVINAPNASALITSLESFAEAACVTCLVKFPTLDEIRVIIAKEKGLLHAERISYELTCRKKAGNTSRSALYMIENLRLPTTIGIHPWERAEKQIVRINLILDVGDLGAGSPVITPALDVRTLVNGVSAVRFQCAAVESARL
jgi:dihydroneopterin aldolase/2-amino-4-hydroxy-6-hydroxymethyldihydropteridine diphosphokinase/dihydropteroate synthase